MFIFLFPLVLSVIGSLFFFFAADTELKWKVTAIVLAIGAAAAQFTLVPAEVLHFGIPVAVQLVLCFWFVIYFQIS